MKKFIDSKLFVASIVLVTTSFSVNASSTVEAGTLDIGSTSISGTLAGNCVIGDCNGLTPDGFAQVDTQDDVIFTINTGSQLDSIFVTTSNVSGPADFSASFNLSALSDPSTSLIFTPFLPLSSTSGNQVTSALSAGTYVLSMFGQGASAPGVYALDYSIELNISAVPIPGAIWLFGSALAGLFAFKRRHTVMA
jgi:hypothetical protein